MASRFDEINNCFLRIDSDKLGEGNTSNIHGNELHFTNTPELSSGKSANVQPVQILGRANPLWIFSSSGERSWNLELRFFATQPASQETKSTLNTLAKEAALVAQEFPRYPNDAEQNNFEVRKQVLDKVNWCESLVYPIYIEGISRGIPEILFVFGDMLSVKCICTDVNSTFPGPWYVKANNTLGYPLYALVNLTLKQTGGASFSHLDVRNNKHNGVNIT